MPFIKIVDASTGEEIEREMNEEELQAAAELAAKWEAEMAAQTAQAEAKAAILERLGISEEEAKLLFS